MKNSVISFIGGGNMARSLIGGLISNGVNPTQIRVADVVPTPPATAHYPIQVFTDNVKAIQDAQVVVLAVKPQQMQSVAKQLRPHLIDPAPLFISIAAGIRLNDLNRWLGETVPLVRVMPNTPALVRSGASALFANSQASELQRELAENILRAVGLTVWLKDEDLMDLVTALSGSGPAYFFLIMELLEKAAIDLGLPQEQASLLTIQTAFGAAKMALESNEDVSILRNRVTSKGGTTEQAIKTLHDGDIEILLKKTLIAARDRSMQLAEELGVDKA
jgi:pyrroline-5-carboxylate reductase